MRALDTSRMTSIGGQGTGTSWSLTVSSAAVPPILIPSVDAAASARTLLVLTWGAVQHPMHPLSGPLVATRRLPSFSSSAPIDLRLAHADSGHGITATNVAAGEYDVEARYYRSDAMFAGSVGSLSSISTIWLRLTPATHPIDDDPRGAMGAAMTVSLTELGFALCVPEVFDRVCADHRDEIARHGGLLEAMGATDIGETLLDRGVFFPIWGMRPWLYRVAALGPGRVSCPVGREVVDPVVFATPDLDRELHLVPGSALRGASTIDWRSWPRLVVPGEGNAIQIRIFVSGGPEPIAPFVDVGIVPTITIERVHTNPTTPSSAAYGLVACDPLRWFESLGTSEERLLVHR